MPLSSSEIIRGQKDNLRVRGRIKMDRLHVKLEGGVCAASIHGDLLPGRSPATVRSPRRSAAMRCRSLDEDACEIVRRRLDRRPPAGTDHAAVSKPMHPGSHGGGRVFARRRRLPQQRRPGGGLAWGIWGKRCPGRNIRGRPKRNDSPLLNAIGISRRRERRKSVRRKTPT